jgi:LPS-assembly protein
VEEGFYRDANDNWIRKEPEFNFQFGHQIGDLPIDYMFTAIYGRWNNQSITSLHQDYNLYFQGHPIKVFGNSSLSLGSGVEVIRESHDDSRSAALRYDAVLSTDWTKKWSTYVGYHYTGQNDALFAFGQPELAREFDSGISYQINEIDKVAYGQPYDMINRRVYERDYFWYHNLQCWLATIEIRAYTQQKTQFVFTLTTNKF